LVFTFVALWHDIQLRLLLWAWLIVLFIIPEAVAKIAFPKKRFVGRERRYRMYCAVGAVGNLLMMISANIVGFAFGLDGLQSIIKVIFSEFSGKSFVLPSLRRCMWVTSVILTPLYRPSIFRHGVLRNLCRCPGHV
jgi:D-alanyl-lipoteichoic acid acyltransferase DltB (MBOAT superfamily)